MTIKEFILSNLLKAKKGSEISSVEMVQLVNVYFNLSGSERYNAVKLRLYINELRREEIAVLANKRGYFISYEEEDILESIISLETRMAAIESAQRGLKNCLRNVKHVKTLG